MHDIPGPREMKRSRKHHPGSPSTRFQASCHKTVKGDVQSLGDSLSSPPVCSLWAHQLTPFPQHLPAWGGGGGGNTTGGVRAGWRQGHTHTGYLPHPHDLGCGSKPLASSLTPMSPINHRDSVKHPGATHILPAFQPLPLICASNSTRL